MTYVSYQLSQAGRRLSPSERRAADAQMGQLSASLSDTVRWLRTRTSSWSGRQAAVDGHCVTVSD